VVLGVSADSVKKHQKFKEKYDLPFTLVADVDKEISRAYGVWMKKKFMGREYMGIDRVTFVIDEHGRIAHVFEKVDAATHADEVAELLT
jgi:peroxiredoxin Q/BCP